MLLAVLAAPQLFLTSTYALYVAREAIYLAILAATWSLLAGIAGQFSFAHVALGGLAGYGAVIWERRVDGLFGGVYSGIVVGAALTWLVGTLLGVLLLRLRGAYLALFTIAFAQILQLMLIGEYGFTGGRNGLLVRHATVSDPARAYYVLMSVLVVILLVIYAMLRTRIGLFLRAFREDADAAAAVAINIVALKVFIFSVTSFLVGIAGAIYYTTLPLLTPDQMSLEIMAVVAAVAVVGSLESPLGAALGGLGLSWALETLRSFTLSGVRQYTLAALICFGLACAVVMMLRGTTRRAVRDASRWASFGIALGASWVLLAIATNRWVLDGVASSTRWLAAAVAAAGGVLSYGLYARQRLRRAERRKFAAFVTMLMLSALVPRLAAGGPVPVDLGFWRYAAFGAILILTLRFARNGLLYPLLEYFSGRSALMYAARRTELDRTSLEQSTPVSQSRAEPTVSP